LVTQDDPQRRRRFNNLFAAYGPDIVAYCSWRADSETDAQDAAADVFLIAWRRLDAVPEGDAAKVWLYATARRVIANQRRSTRRRAALRERLTHEQPPLAMGSSDREKSLVHEALHRLARRDREVLLLAEWEGLTPGEIGVVLNCLAVTVRGRLHRARNRFRTAYQELARESRADAGRMRRPRSVAQEGGS